MKKVLPFIVGYPTGFQGEGNEQWYYFLALVMNVMLTWWLKPEFGFLFTACALIHFAITTIYGLKDLVDSLNSKRLMYSILYFVASLILFIVCMIFNWSWTLITSAVVVVAFYIAPDDMGTNIFMHSNRENDLLDGSDDTTGVFLWHIVWFAIFVTITLLLPISIWIRLVIIVTCMILHPFIDSLQGECINIVEITDKVFHNLIRTFKK